MSKEALLGVIDNVICITLITVCILSGGKPVSPIVFSLLEKQYNVKLPTYSIHELLDILDSGNRQLALEEELSYSKITINSYTKVLDVLKSKDIAYTQIAGYEATTGKLKVEGNDNVLKLIALLSSIRTEDNISIKVSYLNASELVITVTK